MGSLIYLQINVRRLGVTLFHPLPVGRMNAIAKEEKREDHHEGVGKNIVFFVLSLDFLHNIPSGLSLSPAESSQEEERPSGGHHCQHWTDCSPEFYRCNLHLPASIWGSAFRMWEVRVGMKNKRGIAATFGELLMFRIKNWNKIAWCYSYLWFRRSDSLLQLLMSAE